MLLIHYHLVQLEITRESEQSLGLLKEGPHCHSRSHLHLPSSVSKGICEWRQQF